MKLRILGSCLSLLAYIYRNIVFLYIILMYFFSRKKMIMITVFLEKSILKNVFKIKANFSLCNTEETKTLINPIY